MKTISLKRILVILAAFFTALLLLITPTVQASADETSNIRYTDVLEDLKRDEKFDESKYVAKADDYSLSVIHIAENKARELLIYVYRPSAENKSYDTKAKKISLSKTIGDEADYFEYDLTLLSHVGVFDKYKVEDFTTGSKSVRYYSIAMISRKGYWDIDRDGNNIGNTIQSVLGYKSYKVGQRWQVTTVENSFSYVCENEEVITIEKKVVGTLSYANGFKLWGMYWDYLDSHFVAFSTDKRIDELLSARVRYVRTDARGKKYHLVDDDFIYSLDEKSRKKENVTVECDEKTGNDGSGLFGRSYTWKRIESTADFLSEDNMNILGLSQGSQEDLENTQWVLRFLETDAETGANVLYKWQNITVVSEVVILELTFITDGETYKMGVVDDYLTPDSDPEGGTKTAADDFKEWLKEEFSNFWDKTKTALKIVVVILCLVLLGVLIIPFLPFIFQLLGTLVKWLLKGAWWLICFPWNLIGKLFKKKNKKNGDNQ